SVLLAAGAPLLHQAKRRAKPDPDGDAERIALHCHADGDPEHQSENDAARPAHYDYLRPQAASPFCSAANDCVGARISQRKPFSTSFSTLPVSTCGWPQGMLWSLQIARMSSIAAATSGCSYWRG